MTIGELDKEADKFLWEWADRQDQYLVDQFGLAIFGISALFFAYAQVSGSALKLLIAVIGAGGSLTIWMHMWGARKEFYGIRDELRKRNKILSSRLHEATSKWKVGNPLYHPASRLMTYFMALVTWAWTAIVFYRISILSLHPLPASLFFWVLFGLSVAFLLVVVGFTFYRKYCTDRHRESEIRKELES